MGRDFSSRPVGGTAAAPRTGDAQHARETESTLSQALLKAGAEIVGSANSLIDVYSDRVRLSLRRKFTHAAIFLLAAAAAVVWLGAASLATLRGVCGGFTALFGGRAWQGDLVGGLLALLLSALAVVIYQRSFARGEFARLKIKYARSRNEHRKT